MSDEYDSLPWDNGEIAKPTLAGAVTERKCRRHRWIMADGGYDNGTRAFVELCFYCRKPKDEARSRRGKSSRRLGSDQERRAERVYGWEKIGERGQMTDLRGRMFKTQQKASRRPAPALFRSVFAGLDATVDQRIPLLLLSYVKAGVGTDDYIVVRGKDWLDLHGRDEPQDDAA